MDKIYLKYDDVRPAVECDYGFAKEMVFMGFMYPFKKGDLKNFGIVLALCQSSNLAKPVYTTLPGWKEDIRGITEYDKLPENCRNYIEFIEKELGVPVKMVSNGPGRHEIIYRD